MSSGGGWAQVRQQVRTLESQTDSHFHTLSQHVSAAGSAKKSAAPSEDETRIEAQIEELLEKRSALISQLTRQIDAEPTTSSLKTSNLARHRERLAEHRAELSRTRAAAGEARTRAALMSGVRADIAARRAADPGAAEQEYMLDERDRLDRSHSVVDGTLAQAYAVNENLAAQRETLAGVNRRIVAAASQIPGINSLMGRIGAKRRRDGVILGGFIALCVLVLFFFG